MSQGNRWLSGVRYRPALSTEHVLETSAQGEHVSEVALSQASPFTISAASPLPDEPRLADLIKTKFVGYLRWTAFAMLLAPIAFWIASRH
jgi:hypothetical protein